MAKSIRDAGAAAFDGMAAKGAKGAQGMQEQQKAQEGRHYRTERLYFKVTPEVKSYLQAAAYAESTPTRRVSMTDYVCMLVEKDMQAHPEYMTGEGE